MPLKVDAVVRFDIVDQFVLLPDHVFVVENVI
jgi:hypothetical protein